MKTSDWTILWVAIVCLVVGFFARPVFDSYYGDMAIIEKGHDHDEHEGHDDHDEHSDHMDEDEHDHHSSHEGVEVNKSKPIPAVTITVVEDAKSGYNLMLELENFTMTPEKASQDNRDPNEGHAHLYINGEKIGRLYSTAYHISGDLLEDGANEIAVTLNANDHSDWLVYDAHVESIVTVNK